jgi:hypothetical protein
VVGERRAPDADRLGERALVATRPLALEREQDEPDRPRPTDGRQRVVERAAGDRGGAGQADANRKAGGRRYPVIIPTKLEL